MKIEVYFKMIVGEDKYPSNLTLNIQKDMIKSMVDIDILTHDFLESLLSTDFEVTEILVGDC